jgi:hypothetical protein
MTVPQSASDVINDYTLFFLVREAVRKNPAVRERRELARTMRLDFYSLQRSCARCKAIDDLIPY